MRARMVIGAASFAAIGIALIGHALFRAAPVSGSARPAGDGAVTMPGLAQCDTSIVDRLRTASADRGAGLFGACAGCHSVGRRSPDLDGPNLYGVVGARMAQRRDRYAYTAALRRIGGTWNAATLDAWLTNPRSVAPGTSMRFAGLPDCRARADVIAFLNTQGGNLPIR